MKLLKTIPFLLAAAAVFAGCDSVGEDDRYIELGKIEAKRTVLLEEFTGQRCTNCPDGHADVAKLHEQYGDRLIAVCIHGGPLSISSGMSGFVGLATPTGEQYYNEAGAPALPAGRINRATGAIDRSEWADAIRREIEKESPAELTVEASLDEGAILAEATVMSSADIQGNLQFWVVEDNIVAYQYDHGQHVFDYTHDHVFRASMGGADGYPAKISKGVSSVVKGSIACDETWNAENISIVAILSNADGVVQAAMCKLVAAE